MSNMASIGVAPMFTCNEAYCVAADVFEDRENSDLRSLKIRMRITEAWLIRGAWHLETVSEQDVIDHLADGGVQAMWVDSESDARAMAGMFA